MIELTLAGVKVELPTNSPILLLRERDGDRYLPISVGVPEASSIIAALQGLVHERPQTHDLLRKVIEETGGAIEAVWITDLREEVFYASLRIRRGTESFSIEARPSDAISVAVRVSAPVLVAEAVLDQAGILLRDEKDDEEEMVRFRAFLETVTPEDFRQTN